MIYKDPLPHVSLRGPVIRNLLALVNQAMAVVRLTSLHLSIPSSGMTPPLDCLDSAPVTPAPLNQHPRHIASVLFASDIEVIEYNPVRSSRMEEPDSPNLLQPFQDFTIPTPGGDISDQSPAVITITPPAYVLFPFTDPFDDDTFSMPSFPTLPAPSGFAPIGQPGSLPGPSVRLDTWDQELSSLMQSVSLSSLGLTGWKPMWPDTHPRWRWVTIPSLLLRLRFQETIRFGGHCHRPRCSRTALFIVPRIARQARHRSCVLPHSRSAIYS